MKITNEGAEPVNVYAKLYTFVTWKSVYTAPPVMYGLVALARADLASSEFGLADAGAAGSQLFARRFGVVECQVHLVLDRADKVGGHVPLRCNNAIGFERASISLTSI